MRSKVLILCGGRSQEHEISLISAIHVLEALDTTRFEPLVVGISKTGTWFLESKERFFVGKPRADQIRLNEQAPTVSLSPSSSGRGVLQAAGTTYEFDIAFPILHGPFGEDGTLQGFLEILGVPYVGANCGSSWICMDKALTKTLCQGNGLAVADFVVLTDPKQLELKQNAIRKIGPPWFVKPARLGSSVGITKVKKQEDLLSAVKLAFEYDTKVLVERAIVGREIEVAVLGPNQKAAASQPGEIVPNPKAGFYSYEAKYLLEDGAELHVPAKLDPILTKNIQSFALKAFDLLECDGMARVDLFLETPSNTLYLNEVNTIPGFTPISMYPKLWQVSGFPYRDLITELIELGFERSKARPAKI